MTQQARLPQLIPSTNNLFATVVSRTGKSHRVKTSEYAAWKAETVIRLRLAMKPVKTFPVSVHIIVVAGKDFRKSRDIANIEKAVGDALVEAEILPDDKVKYVWDSRQTYLPQPNLAKSFALVRVAEGIEVSLRSELGEVA